MERFVNLSNRVSVEVWRDQVFQLANNLGYERTLLAITPGNHVPVEAEGAFLQSNYCSIWRSKYDCEKMVRIDPTVSHCTTKSIPLIWSPDTFSTHKQMEMYEEACGYGLRSGVTLPIHGTNGELGMLCVTADTQPNKAFVRDAISNIPELACFRDFIFETSLQFIKHPVQDKQPVTLTTRELECLKWSAIGKSSWDIGQILNCSTAVVNFHFANIRCKFSTSTRRQALAKAICMGIVNPT